MKEGLFKVENDLYDIAFRLKQIDPSYELYLNRITERYEVHSKGTLQAVVPFSQLDARTIEHIRKTRIENLQIVLAEIEKNNKKLEEAESNSARNNILALLQA